MGQGKAVFLDRDGTLITNRAYGNDPSAVCWYPGVFEALRGLRRLGYHLVVVSNQSAVARGYCSCADVEAFNEVLGRHLRSEGIEISAFHYSPYHPEGTVPPWNRSHPSRKPSPGMLLRAAGELDLDLNVCVMVGDSAVDLEAGRNAGCRTVLVLTGLGCTTLAAVGRGETKPPDAVIPHVGDLLRLTFVTEIGE